MQRDDGEETQELCLQALRSVRQASEGELLATLTELEGLVPHACGSHKTLINAQAAHELLETATEAVNCLRVTVAQAALRLLNAGLHEGRIIETLALEDNLRASSNLLVACSCKCWMLDGFASASVLELSVKLHLRLVHENRARVCVLLGESIHSLSSAALRVSLLCLGRCLAQPEEPYLKRKDLARRYAFQIPAVDAARLFLLFLESTSDLVCQVDAELEEVVACLVGRIPYAVTAIYGQIIHKAVHAVNPEGEGESRGAVPAAEEFDFYKKILSHADLIDVFLPMKIYELNKVLNWKDTKHDNSNDKKDMFDAGIRPSVTPTPTQQRVMSDGIAIFVKDYTLGVEESDICLSSEYNLRAIPLYAITQIARCKDKKLKIVYLHIPYEGTSNPRLLRRQQEIFFDGKQVAYLVFKSDKEAESFRLNLLKEHPIKDMEAYDLTFIDGILNEVREPLEPTVADQLLNPSNLIQINNANKLRREDIIDKSANDKSIKRRIMFASTKDIGESTSPSPAASVSTSEGEEESKEVKEKRKDKSINKDNQTSVFSPLAKSTQVRQDREAAYSRLGVASSPKLLSQWRRVSLATTKRSELEGGEIESMVAMNINIYNQQQEYNVIYDKEEDARERERRVCNSSNESDKGTEGEPSIKRCEDTGNGFNTTNELIHHSSIHSRRERDTRKYIQQQQSIEEREGDRYIQDDIRLGGRHGRRVTRRYTDSDICDNQENQYKSFSVSGSPEDAIRAVSSGGRRSESFGNEILRRSSRNNNLLVKGLVQTEWNQQPTELDNIVKLLEAVKRRIQQDKLAKIQETRKIVMKIYQKNEDKLLTLLKAQQEERRQLEISYDQAKKKIISRVEEQMRVAEEIPSLNLPTVRSVRFDDIAETAGREIDSMMDMIKKGIYDRLAHASEVSND